MDTEQVLKICFVSAFLVWAEKSIFLIRENGWFFCRMRGGENVSLFEGHKFDQDLRNREETDSGVCADIGELLIMIV